MTDRGLWLAVLMTVSVPVCSLFAQTSSLGARKRGEAPEKRPEVLSREAPKIERNEVYRRYSWIASPRRRPKTFKVGDLITIIVREQRTFEAEADLETKKRFKLKSELEAFLKATAGGIGAAEFRRGKPTIDYQYDARLKTEGDSEREDKLTMRLTGKIIDVKPNGVLVLEAKARVQHDDEVAVMTLTGNCRKEDVTADNTILSTQLADKNVTVNNTGALRDATSRGWILRLLDLLKPI